MQTFKRIIFTLIAVIVLLILTITVLLFVIDPNRYKSRIEAFAQNRANISLQIKGDLSWNLFPQFGISIKETQISALDDTKNPVASVDNLTLSLKLIPLIKGDIDIKQLHVDGLMLEILTYPDGSQNIDSFLTPKPQNPALNQPETISPTKDQKSENHAEKPTQKPRALAIAAMSFTNARFNFENQLTKQQFHGDNIDFIIEKIQLNAPNFSIDALKFNKGNLYFSDALLQQTFDYQEINFNLQKLELHRTFVDDQRIFATNLGQFDLKKGEIKAVKNDQTLLLKPQNITIENFHYSNSPDLDPWNLTKLEVQDLQISSQKSAKMPALILDKITINAKNISPLTTGSLQFKLSASQKDHLHFDLSGQSTITFTQVSKSWNFKDNLLKANINRWQNFIPSKTIALQLEADLALNLTQDTLLISPLTLLLDEQKITGDIAFTSLQQQQGRITLKGKKLDLSPYLPEQSTTSPNIPNNSNAKEETNIKPSTSTNQRALTINTKLQELKINTFVAQNIGIDALLQNDLITISEAKAMLLGGNMMVKGHVKTANETPIIDGNITITALPLTNLLTALQKSLPITGNLNLNGQLQTQGFDKTSIMKHLQGNVQVNISNGQLIGMDYEQLVCEGFALLKKENFRQNSAKPTTNFNKLNANATIRNGVISNNSLQMEIPGLAATGNGTINLNNETLDYRISLLLKESTGVAHCQIDQYLKNVTIPLHCQGSYINAGANLCGIDQNAIGKMIANLAKGKIESTIKENIQDILPPVLQPKKEESRQAPKPKDVIKAFEGLFNR
ncbi:AsmA family protein [Ignatzschineria rhizosphaerae]|uniref:AsmA family protein n=1 Tax=Ignatzschineria rhizosphaerae TaxID=2923279 RepID=A0ABY3X7H9_9GAMM|nr:AsmA family protein [Ignatzschineria rhizosphaerae]UNM96705.1 AsmA family protein [Ignatzschineria rhizosphaerae]